MTAVECGIKAFDIHELLCHFIAKRHGFYEDADLDVRVLDTTFIPDAELPTSSYFQVACGAAYLGRRDGFPFKVVLAATDRPLFWLHASPEIERIEDLSGKRIATYPPIAPPHHFNRVALRNHGLDPDRDVTLLLARDDIIRLGLLRDRDVDAAVISSAISPIAVQRLGLNTLTLLGDEVKFVTTGVATTEKIMQDEPELVAALVSVFQKSLTMIHRSPEQVVPIVADVLRESEEVAKETLELLRPCYTAGGSMPMDAAQAAIDVMGNELPSADRVEASDLYDFSLLGEGTAG